MRKMTTAILLNLTQGIMSTILIVLVFFSLGGWSYSAEPNLKNVHIQVYFSPGGGATNAIVREIGAARKEVLVQAYVLSSQLIVEALMNAHKRGVAVSLIIDKSERGEGLTPGTILANAGVPVFVDDKHILAHSNIIVIDKQTVITGSFSFTKAAEESNAEDLVVVKSEEVAREYRNNWERHRAHSRSH
jgi:phosphatidylserine/phosphatidylglycerophosphate/cardiolipin synthase-like enzyme